jgi:hypothetical protein
VGSIVAMRAIVSPGFQPRSGDCTAAFMLSVFACGETD